jgi:hypothetical protein
VKKISQKINVILSSPFVTGYSIVWNNIRIVVYRSDVVCTNGIIHVIDYPFIQESDVRVPWNSASKLNAVLLPSFITILLSTIVRLFN